MKRTWLLKAMAVAAVMAVLTVGGAASASAQFLGMPVWNNPSGGTGLTINGDYGKPNNNAGGGNAFGGRASLGLGTLTVTAGIDNYKPSGAGATSATSFGGDVAFGVIGGPLVPVKINIQGGAAHSSSGPGLTQVTGAVGIGVTLPMPGISIEPYISPGIRYTRIGSATVSGPATTGTNFGFAVGANIGFGMLGVHVAYDHSKFGGVSQGIFGIGAHLALKVPLGM